VPEHQPLIPAHRDNDAHQTQTLNHVRAPSLRQVAQTKMNRGSGRPTASGRRWRAPRARCRACRGSWTPAGSPWRSSAAARRGGGRWRSRSSSSPPSPPRRSRCTRRSGGGKQRATERGRSMRRGHEFGKLGFRSTGSDKRRLETRAPEGTHRHGWRWCGQRERRQERRRRERRRRRLRLISAGGKKKKTNSAEYLPYSGLCVIL
jgi:hypothetical protein